METLELDLQIEGEEDLLGSQWGAVTDAIILGIPDPRLVDTAEGQE